MSFSFDPVFHERWSLRKPAVSGTKGVVATQHYLASQVGSYVLKHGGNAIDASVASGLALGTVEPWMSGIGGGGFMTIHLADANQVSVVEFGMRAPLDSTPDDYPLTGRMTGASSFHWPEVENNVNVRGPLSIAVPGHIKGMELALETFGTWDWTDIIEPACVLAENGLPLNWYGSQLITSMARALRNYEETRKTYLPDGLPPHHTIYDEMNSIPLGNLDKTYRILQREGPDSFYMGTLAEMIAEDLAAVGSRIRLQDLNEYSASVNEPFEHGYRNHQLYGPSRRSAGPTMVRTLTESEGRWSAHGKSKPTGEDYLMYAQLLLEAYEYRLEHLGDGARKDVTGATSHLCTADAKGNVVSHTQTIMSGFGSHIMLPQTGILLNNGMMWFDPRPGRPNSVEGGRRPLSNMCPIIGQLDNDSVFAVGACGGRMIFPAVFQIISLLCDFGMNVTDALHQPRIDVSGTDLITIMDSMDQGIIEQLASEFTNVRIRPNGVSPMSFALPQLVMRESNGLATGGCFIPSPTASVEAA